MNNEIILLVFLMAFLLAKTIKDRFDLPEPRIRRIEEPLYKPRKDVALSCDMLNSGNVMTEENNTETATNELITNKDLNSHGNQEIRTLLLPLVKLR